MVSHLSSPIIFKDKSLIDLELAKEARLPGP